MPENELKVTFNVKGYPDKSQVDCFSINDIPIEVEQMAIVEIYQPSE